MTVTQKACGLLSRAKILKNTVDQTDEIGRLQDKQLEIEEVNRILRGFLELSAAFANGSVDVDTSIFSFSRYSNLAMKVLDGYEQNAVTSSLTKGRDWRDLINGVKNTKDEFEKLYQSAWEKFGYRLFSGSSPTQIRKTMVPSDKNRQKLAVYEENYKKFQRFKEELPKGSETFEEVRSLANLLKSIEFDSDLPEDARDFLHKIHSGGIPLDQVTDAMFLWLDSTNTRSDYLLIQREDD